MTRLLDNKMLRRHANLALSAASAALVTLLLSAGAARAVPVDVTIPAVTASPGSTADISIVSSPAPAGLGITSIDFRVTMDTTVVQSATLLGVGYVQSWGGPFANVTRAFAAVAAAGGAPATSTSTLVATIRVTLKPNAVLGTDMPVVFQHFFFNEGSPSVQLTNGVLRVRAAGLGVESDPRAAFALASVAPSPARNGARLTFTLGAGGQGATRLALYSVDGRRVRTLADGVLPAGAHSREWDLRDESGALVGSGMYFARLEWGGRVAAQRLVVVR